MLKVPKKWFFFNPSSKFDNKRLSKFSNTTGIVFFKNNLDTHDKFFIKIKPYIDFCKKKKIKFLLPFSLYWANKYQAFGIFIENSNDSLNFLINYKIIKKKFFLATKVHSLTEAIKFLEFDIIFISPVFKTFSFPNKKPMKRFIFLSLCLFFKNKKTFALGGVNNQNYSKLKNKYLDGFGGITNFINKENFNEL